MRVGFNGVGPSERNMDTQVVSYPLEPYPQSMDVIFAV